MVLFAQVIEVDPQRERRATLRHLDKDDVEILTAKGGDDSLKCIGSFFLMFCFVYKHHDIPDPIEEFLEGGGIDFVNLIDLDFGGDQGVVR